MPTEPRARPSLVRAVATTAAVLGAVALAGCTSDDEPTGARSSASAPTDLAASETAPVGTPTDVVTDLDAPWSVVFVGDTPLISERDSARVLELSKSGSTRVVGTVPGVSASGESGLLGLAVGPDGGLYVYSTGADGNRIQRFDLDGSAGSFALGSPVTVLDALPSNTFHDGGRIAFGPDGMLYATVGDAGSSPDAQDRDSLAGKILRMTPEGDVPSDNPFRGSLVYSLGHRNVQGLGWASDGTLFAAEFGENTWDELNVIEAGGNYGWPKVEGKGGGSEFVDPVQQWHTDDASPSGLAVVDDTVFIANLRGEVLRGVPVSDPSTSHEYFAGEYGRLRTVLPSPDGGLWIVTNNTDGRGTPASGDDRILSVDLS
ncbi:oxidoreductase [Frondihabitans sucicola]|uniref:Oxidoreductase n=1 Tax=Frondihabitans sucicola TaxID=1268041 RepID=A0ABM8GHQ9_9MICO|nr:PQQ-dependent sugar dehydrogenase [Frondihabitans sucicola]BDZ47880.1 oxidoreductase [Frondihabitans sucicola]